MGDRLLHDSESRDLRAMVGVPRNEAAIRVLRAFDLHVAFPGKPACWGTGLFAAYHNPARIYMGTVVCGWSSGEFDIFCTILFRVCTARSPVAAVEYDDCKITAQGGSLNCTMELRQPGLVHSNHPHAARGNTAVGQE